MMNKISIFLTIFLTLFLLSCKSTQQSQTAVESPSSSDATTNATPNISTPGSAATPSTATPNAPIAKQRAADEIIAYSIHQRSKFEWFSANLSGSIDYNGDYNTFGGQIRIKNGEEIWIMVSKMSFEIARLRITPDSVFLYNKFEKTVTIRDFGFFKELSGVDFTFAMLQDILLGNYFLGEPAGEYSYQYLNGDYAFKSNRLMSDIAYEFVLDDGHCKFWSLTMRDTKNRAIDVNYEDYALFNDNLYPQKVLMQMRNPLLMELQLNYQKIQINVPQNLPFSIPESVKKI